jgi:two-component system, LytTR family, sensor kinase
MPAEQNVNAPARRRFFGQWWLVSGFWLLIALASMLEMSLFHPSDFTDLLRFAARQWLPWILLSPLIMWIATAYTLDGANWRRTIWVHLVACVLVTGGLGALAYLEGPPPFLRGDSRPFPRNDVGQFIHQDDRAHPSQEPLHGPGPHRAPPSAASMIVRLATFQLPIFWAVWGVAHALRFYQRAKDRERRESELESRLAQARLQALRMQLNPHFLFNTLNSIASLVYDQPRAADEMIESLGELLRLTLNAPDRQEVTLREELHFLDRYLHIEQTRFGERLSVVKNIEPATLDAIVPILVLQPIAENAIKHGIEEQLAPGVVSIDVKRSGDILHLQVSDNGRGLSATADGTVKEGVGLGNTRARLRELYGDKGSLEFGVRPGGGFLVEIKIPWRALPATAPG